MIESSYAAAVRVVLVEDNPQLAGTIADGLGEDVSVHEEDGTSLHETRPALALDAARHQLVPRPLLARPLAPRTAGPSGAALGRPLRSARFRDPYPTV